MIVGHFILLVVDSVYTIDSSKEVFGFCAAFPDWSRSLFGAFSTLNDLVQVGFLLFS
jgi:hypothetical protein